MEKDIVPELLELIENEFDSKILGSEKIKNAVRLLRDNQATYKDANEFAIELGDMLSEVFKENITASILPDGKMYHNIADRILNPTMSKNHELISGFAADVQTELNRNAGLKMKGQKAELNQDRVDGIIKRVSDEDDFDKIKWILDEPVKNFSQSIIDDTIKKNVEFHAKAGLKPKIIRRSTGKCCDWCEEIVGTYEYPDVPKDIYRRHRYCRCTVDYYPGDGKRQNVHTKQWTDPEKNAKIEARKQIGLEPDKRKVTKTKHSRIRQSQREITNKDINFALENPIHKEPIEVDNLGRRSQKIIGEFTTVIINPDSMVVITTYDTKERIRNKYINKGE